MLSHQNINVLSSKELSHSDSINYVRFKILKRRLLNSLHRQRLFSFKTRNKKLMVLIAKKQPNY